MDRIDQGRIDQGYGYTTTSADAGDEVTAPTTAAPVAAAANPHAAAAVVAPGRRTQPLIAAARSGTSADDVSGVDDTDRDDSAADAFATPAPARVTGSRPAAAPGTAPGGTHGGSTDARASVDTPSSGAAETPPNRTRVPRAMPSCAVTAIAIAHKARPLRRDAERNRLLILSAAKTVFAQRGLDASLDEIAKEAGLGVGTVYRRFPNRDALIDALSADVVSSIERIMDEALAMPSAWDGLRHFMAAMLESQTADKGLRDAMMARHSYASAEHDIVRAKIEPALYDIVSRAQREGDLRPDVTATDIGVLEVAALGIAEFTASQSPEVWRRHLTILLDGLRARPAGANSALEQPPLDNDQANECMIGWKYGSRETPRQRQKPN